MNNHKAFLGDKELKRGDTITAKVTGFAMAFAYVTDDGQIATQEPGESVRVRNVADLYNVQIEKEPAQTSRGLTNREEDLSAAASKLVGFDVLVFRKNGEWKCIPEKGGAFGTGRNPLAAVADMAINNT